MIGEQKQIGVAFLIKIHSGQTRLHMRLKLVTEKNRNAPFIKH